MGLQHAASEGLVPENVARNAKVPDAYERKTRSFTGPEVEAIQYAAKGDRLEAAWLLQLGLGLRPGELLALAWSDIDGSDVHIRHGQRREGGKLLPRDRLKTDASMRVVGLPDVVKKALDEHRLRQGAERAAAGEAWENSLGLIITTERGLPMREETYRRQFLCAPRACRS